MKVLLRYGRRRKRLSVYGGWCETYLYDSNGYITSPLAVYLDAGEHTISVYAGREPMILGEIEFTHRSEPLSYGDYLSSFSGMSSAEGQLVRIEAENASMMSSQMLYPRQDQSSPAVYPSSPKLLHHRRNLMAERRTVDRVGV